MEISPWQMYKLVRKHKLDFFAPGDILSESKYGFTYECRFPWYWRVFFAIRLFIYK